MSNDIDTRVLLNHCLLKQGCESTLAHLISVEVGGSQIFVDEEYLVEIGIQEKELRRKYMMCIAKFYFSDMREY